MRPTPSAGGHSRGKEGLMEPITLTVWRMMGEPF